MDLREFKLTDKQIAEGCKVLDYQPFILSDDVQVGVAYSWVHNADSRLPPVYVFHRDKYREQWDAITEINERVRRTYDGFIREIASRYPGKTLLDVACNNGYFPVRAEMFGMAPSTGLDMGGQYKHSIAYLNRVCGTHATFQQIAYDSNARRAPFDKKFDVVVASAIMCHLPDPLHFLSYIASLAKEAIFFWDQIIDTKHLLIAYRKPHHALHDRPFPYCFNDNTRVSRGLIELSLNELGFKTVTELPWHDDWLSPYITSYLPPGLDPHAVAAFGTMGARASEGFSLLNEVVLSAKHVPILAIR